MLRNWTEIAKGSALQETQVALQQTQISLQQTQDELAQAKSQVEIVSAKLHEVLTDVTSLQEIKATSESKIQSLESILGLMQNSRS